MGTVEAADPGCFTGRAATQDGHALGDERDPLFAADRMSLAVFASGRISATLDRLQHLSEIPEGRHLGYHLGASAHPITGKAGTGSEPDRRCVGQPVAQIGGKGGGRDDQVGYDAGKKVKGRKLHALVDTEGLPIRVVVHSAGIQDRDGAALVLDKIRKSHPWLQLVWADSGYNARQVVGAVAKVPCLRIEIVKRTDNMSGFLVLPRRWVVERTFSWFGRNRRLAKDWENLADTLHAFVTIASIQLALRRLAQK
jgi:transposase